MDSGPRKLQQRTREEAEHQVSAEQQQQAARELTNVEEILRRDAEKVVVPPAIEARLRDSVAKETPPRKGWFARLFSR